MPTKKNNSGANDTKSYKDKKGKAHINEIMSNFDLTNLDVDDTKDTKTILASDEFDVELPVITPEYDTYNASKILSEDNPNETQQVVDMDIDSVKEDVIITKPVLKDAEEELEVIVIPEEVAPCDNDFSEYAHIDNEYRPAKKDKEREQPPTKEASLEPKEGKKGKDSKKDSVNKHANLNFTPKAAKEYARIRRKYKIDKDNIFSENGYVDGFILAKGESLLRRYDALKVNGGNVGRILVTNKRLLFNTSEKAEIPLDTVNGIRSEKYWKISWAKFIFSLIFLGIAAFVFVYDLTKFAFFENRNWLIYVILAAGGVLALIGVIFLLTFARKRFALKIFAKSSSEFITYNSKRRKKELAAVTSFIVAKPGKHIDKFIREVGALIQQSKDGYFD